jgi:phosphatidate cytidylyltransferase
MPERPQQGGPPSADGDAERDGDGEAADRADASTAASTAPGMVGGRNLPAAIAVGVVLASVFLGTLLWHPAAFTALVAVLTMMAYVESSRVLRTVDVRIDVPVLVVSTLVMLFGAYQARHAGQAIGLVVLLFGGIAWLLTDTARRDVVRTLATTLLFGLWVGFLASFAVLLVNRPSGGAVAVLAVAGAAVLTDIGGYAFGVTMGRHKVAPSISPKKSWEGLLGGLATATVVGAVVLPLLGDLFTPVSAALVVLVCGITSFVGDLTESMLKRDLGVKDLGSILPGHGGILDRVDGILLALPVGFFAVELLA